MSEYRIREGKKPTIMLTFFVCWSKTNLMHGVAFGSWLPPPSQSSRREQPESLTFIRRRRRARYKFGNQEKGISISKRAGEFEGDERPLNADEEYITRSASPIFSYRVRGKPQAKIIYPRDEFETLKRSKSSCVYICLNSTVNSVVL